MSVVDSAVRFARDSLVNLTSQLGTARDKGAQSSYEVTLLTDSDILSTYRGSWLPRKIVDIPAFDSVRAGREWQAESNVIEAIEEEQERLNFWPKLYGALQRSRLWGGGAILIGTGGNTAEPLDSQSVGKGGVKYLTSLSRRQLSAGAIEWDPASPYFGKPSFYYLVVSHGKPQLQIHPSRLALFTDNTLPDDDLNAFNLGWGDSVFISVLDACKNADATAGNIASLVFEAKVDVFGIPNFMQNIGSEKYRNDIITRYTLANTTKGVNGALIRDKEEEYDTKTVNFSNLPEVLDRFLQIAAGAADIPVTRLLGQSPAGMNSTGESDVRNYYDRLSSMQKIITTPALRNLDECLIRSATGARDPSIYYNWAPLWQISEKERSDILNTKATAARTLVGTGGTSPQIVPIEAISDAVVNSIIEDGSLPGLEAAIEEYGKLSEQPEPTAEELAAAAGVAPANQNGPQPAAKAVAAKVAVGDSLERSLYVSRNLLNGDDVVKWAKAQGFTSTLPAGDMHVTVIFSRASVDWMKMGETWTQQADGGLVVNPGGPRQVEKFGGGAVVLLFAASALSWRNADMRQMGASTDFPDYQPHITISYDGAPADLSKVQPYQGVLRFGPELFAEVNEDWMSGVTEE